MSNPEYVSQHLVRHETMLRIALQAVIDTAASDLRTLDVGGIPAGHVLISAIAAENHRISLEAIRSAAAGPPPGYWPAAAETTR